MHLKHRGDMDQLSAVSVEWIFTRHSNHKKNPSDSLEKTLMLGGIGGRWRRG